MTQFENPHAILDGFESLCRHHYAKQDVREQQLCDLPYAKLPKEANVLDIGCGPGLYLDFWMTRPETKSWKMNLLDHSEPALKHCAEIAKHGNFFNRINLLQHDLKDLQSLEPEVYDLIFIGNTFEYFRDPVAFTQSNILPLLKPGGVLAVRDLDCGILTCNLVDPALVTKIVTARILGCQDVSRPELDTFHNPYIGRDLHRLLEQTGLDRVASKPYYCEFKAPLNEHQKGYLSKLHTSWYIEDRVGHLTAEEKNLWKSYFSIGDKDGVLERPDFFYMESEFLSYGTKVR